MLWVFGRGRNVRNSKEKAKHNKSYNLSCSFNQEQKLIVRFVSNLVFLIYIHIFHIYMYIYFFQWVRLYAETYGLNSESPQNPRCSWGPPTQCKCLLLACLLTIFLKVPFPFRRLKFYVLKYNHNVLSDLGFPTLTTTKIFSHIFLL